MKRIAMVLFLAGCMSVSFGQNAADSISMRKVFGGYQFVHQTQTLNMNQLVEVMKPNEQAYRQIKSAQSTYVAAMIFSYAGGFMIGWPLGTAVAGGKPNWAMAGIGAGLVIIAIPISQSFNKKARQAVEIYNKGLQTSSFWNRNELKLAMTKNGIGLILTF